MTRRVLIREDGVFRISKPGVDVMTASQEDLFIHENMNPFVPRTIITRNFSAAGSVSLDLGYSWTVPPVVVLKSDDDVVSTGFTYSGYFDMSAMKMVLENHQNKARSISAYLFDARI